MISKSLGALEVTFRGNADQLASEGKRAEGAVKGVSKSAEASSAAFVRSFGIMSGATAGVTVAVKGLNAVLDAGKIDDLSRAANLSTKAFQELTYATDKAGISQDAAAKASRVFAINMAELKTDTGQLNDFLSKHLDTLQRQLQASKSQEEAYRLVADAMQRLKSEGDRTILATKLFGEAGTDLVEVLKKGSTGLEENAKRAKALNIIMSDESIKAADELSKKYQELTSNIDRWWMKAAVGVTEYGDKLRKFGLGGLLQGALAGDREQYIQVPFPTDDLENRGKGGVGLPNRLSDECGQSTHEMWTAQEQLNALVERDIELRNQQFEAMERLKEQGKSLYESLRTPQEEFAGRLEEINALYRQGAIDAETAGRAQKRAALDTAGEYLSAASAITGALTQVFENNKTVAIANAVVNTAEGITSALKAPWPLSLAYAAAAAASGYAQIAKIKSTTRGGGGSGGGAAPASSPSVAPQSAAQQGPSETIFVRGIGTAGLISDEVVDGLLRKLLDRQRNGATIVLPRR